VGVVPLPAPDVISVLEHPYLCCVKDVIGYKLFANDGEAGQLEDFVIHEDDAEVRYLAIHLTRSPLMKTVLIRTCNISGFDFANKTLFSPRLCHEIEASPEYENAVR
jgi:hypothetical protein